MSQFNSVYTGGVKKVDDSSNPNSIFKQVTSGKSDAFAPSTLTKLVQYKKDPSKIKEEMENIKDAGIKNLLYHSIQDEVEVKPGSKVEMLKRRFRKIEGWLSQMRDPVDGCGFLDRKKLFDVIPAAASCQDIVDWIFIRCNCSDKFEADRIFQIMVDHAYLIPIELDYDKILDKDTMFTYQADFFYPSKFLIGNDLDYSIYLLRRSSKTGGNLQLSKQEVETFYKIQKEFVSQWKAIVQGSDRQKAYINNLDKKERKLVELREYAFWKSQKLQADQNTFQQILEDDMKLEKQCLTLDQYLSNCSPIKQLEYLERQNESLDYQLKQMKSKTSSECKQLIKNCELFRDMDPFLIETIKNPWKQDEKIPFESIVNEVNASRVYLWINSFNAMMADDQGLQYFKKFLEKDLASENLNFYLAVQQLDYKFPYEEHKNACDEIVSTFIKDGSPQEINIDSQTKGKILERISTANELSQLEHVFDEANEHIFLMMKKDCFPRFVNSEVIKTLVGNYRGRLSTLNFTFTSEAVEDDRSSLQSTALKSLANKKDDSDDENDSKSDLKKKLRSITSDRFQVKKSNTTASLETVSTSSQARSSTIL